MKSQIYQILSIIFGVIILTLSYFLIFLNFSKKVESVLEERKVDIINNVRLAISSYLNLALYYSASQNLRSESHAWIHNGFNPLEFNYLKSCKENLTKFYLNVYASKFYIELPLNINISKIENCFWDLTEQDVFSGKHDEGYFYVNCSNTTIKIYTNDTMLIDEIQIKEFISNNRYWYLYRKIYEWAQENGDKFAQCVCSKVASCQDCTNIKDCYSGLLDSLKEKFKDDKYVECREQSEPCCYHEFGEPCEEGKMCIGWTKKRCYFPKEWKCPLLSNIQYSLENKKQIFSETLYQSQKTDKCYAYYWYENRMETSSVYVCEDRKYYESSPKGPDKVVFAISIWSGWRFPEACKEKKECTIYYKCVKEENNQCKEWKCEKVVCPKPYCITDCPNDCQIE